MKGRRIAQYACWAGLAALLYFFENNGGTRAALLAAILLPLIPRTRKILFGPDRKAAEEKQQVTGMTYSREEAADAGEVRLWQAGDPLRRIHWKLSAKRDELLIREETTEQTDETREESVFPEAGKSGGKGKWVLFVLAAGMLACAALILVIPEGREGTGRLLNRLFEMSEGANAYVYDRFPVSAEGSVTLAVCLLIGILGCWLGMTAATGSRGMALTLIAGIVGGQIYFGLSLPAWAQAVMTAGFILWMARRPIRGREAAVITALIASVFLAVALIWGGIDPGPEEASERVRDLMSQAVGQTAGSLRESPEGETETRHTFTMSLETGEGEAPAEKEYRRVTREEEQMAMPRWVNVLKIAMLLLLTAFAAVAPFLPFLWINRKRRQIQKERERFGGEDIRIAVTAMFQTVIAWLEATGKGAGNVAYRDWTEKLRDIFPAEYTERFREGAACFEEAAYSDHPLTERHRETVRELLEETEERLKETADFRTRVRLKYREFLWI